jgi:hypothetical protein
LEPHTPCAPGGVAAEHDPRNVWFVDALEKEPTGMILNREIRRP